MIKFLKGVWNKNWKGKLTLIAGALILLGAIGGVTYAVLTGEGDEGLMKVGDHQLQWRQADMPISCTHKGLSQENLQHYNTARKEINSRVGYSLLAPCVPWMLEKPFPTHMPGGLTLRVARPSAAPLGPGETRIDFEEPFKAHPGGITQHRFDQRTGQVISVAVWMDPDAPQGLLAVVWLHEMGHVLGLAHDRLEGSVMYTSASGRRKVLSERDVKTLRSTYPK